MSEVVNGYVEADEEHVVLLHRAQDGRLIRHRVPADFAVYFRKQDLDSEAGARLRREWRRDPFCRGYRIEGAWVRTRWRGWKGRRALLAQMNEEGIDTFEGDLNPVKRWMADHPEVSIQSPRRVYFDLETDSRVPAKVAKEEGARILVWSLVNEVGDWGAGVLADDTDAAERRLLGDLYRALEPYDQICAWFGDDFDFPILKLRTRDRRIDLRFVRRWLLMDQVAVYKRLNMQVAESGEEKQSFALNAVARHQLGEGKDPFDARRTYEAWAAGGEERERLVRYCVRDADLLRRIEEKTGYLKLQETISKVCGVFPDSFALRPTAQMDAFLLRLGRQRDQHFPTRTREDREDDTGPKFSGSYNKDPPLNAGILRNVHVVDFSSMYPSIMISWNMSYETKCIGPVNGPIPPGMTRAPKTRTCFTTAKKGIIPEAIEGFLAKRKWWSAKRANLSPGTPEAHEAERWTNAFKVAPNSFYGAQGNEGSRFHRREVAESVSQTGAWLAEKTETLLKERFGASVIYIDTDGLWLMGVSRQVVEDAVMWLNDVHYPALLRECGCVTNIVKIAYEKEFAAVVFVAAKTYTGRYAHFKGTAADPDSKPEIKGLAYKRGDASRLTIKLQAEIIDLLMGGMRAFECGCGEPFPVSYSVKECGACGAPRGSLARVSVPTEDVQHFEEAVMRWRTVVLEGMLAIEDVQVVKGIGKNLKEYVSKAKKGGGLSAQPAHVRVAKLLVERGEDVGEGSKIAYVVVDGSANPQAVIPASDYTGECDRRHLWGSVVWPASEALLQAAFPQHDWKPFGVPPKPRKKAMAAGTSVEQGSLF
jgi:DNA polymerase elongation subunit (family B)